jgi:hypothetical protein
VINNSGRDNHRLFFEAEMRKLITIYTQDSNRRLPALLALQARQQRRIKELRTGRVGNHREYVAQRDALKHLLAISNRVTRAISLRAE